MIFTHKITRCKQTIKDMRAPEEEGRHVIELECMQPYGRYSMQLQIAMSLHSGKQQQNLLTLIHAESNADSVLGTLQPPR